VISSRRIILGLILSIFRFCLPFETYCQLSFPTAETCVLSLSHIGEIVGSVLYRSLPRKLIAGHRLKIVLLVSYSKYISSWWCSDKGAWFGLLVFIKLIIICLLRCLLTLHVFLFYNPSHRLNLKIMGRKRVECLFCGKCVTNIVHHYRVHTNERPYHCKFCHREFKQQNMLDYHSQATHTKERPHKCSVCQKSFSAKCNLLQHLKIHSNVKPHICLFCEKGFVERDALNDHLRRHIGEKWFICAFCPKEYSSQRALRRHTIRSHQDTW